MKSWCDEFLKTQLDMPDPLLDSVNISILSNQDSEYTIDSADEKRHFHPVGGFQYKHITFPVSAGKELNIKIKINKIKDAVY